MLYDSVKEAAEMNCRSSKRNIFAFLLIRSLGGNRSGSFSKFNSEPKLKLSLQKEHSTKLNYVVLHSFTFSAFIRHLSTNSLLTYHANKQCTLSHSNTPTCIDTSLSPKGALSRHIWFSIFKRGLCAVTEGLFSRPPNNNALAYYPISKIELGSIDPK